MQTHAPTDDLARLVPAARAPGRVRVRVGVGAAIVLLIVALVTAVIVSALGQQAGHEVVAPAATDNARDGAAAAGDSPDPGGAAVSTGATADTGAIIFVHVLGAVKNPGLFELRDGARVMDVVAAAGGLVETADPAGVNLARLVSDGEQIVIPHVGDAPPGAGAGAGGTGTGAGPAPGARISINTATVAELDTLPRIGPLMAQRIVDYRAANGRFASIDDLRNVTGIGEKTFEGLKGLITP